MPYLVTKREPRTVEISVEDLFLDLVSDKNAAPVSNTERTGTYTRFYKELPKRMLEVLDIEKCIEILEAYHMKHRELLNELKNPRYSHQIQVDILKELRGLGFYGDSIELQNNIKSETEQRGYIYSDIYTTFFTPKRSSTPGRRKWRQIDAPRDDLKEALRELKNILEKFMGGCFYHTSAFAYIPKRRAVDAGIKHQRNKSNWFLKMDFSNFFGSTTPTFVIDMMSMIYPFSEIVKTERGKSALANCLELCFLDGGLPQGTPISPLLTNIIMIPIDYKLSNHLAKKKIESPNDDTRYGFIYTRYADDIHISNRMNFDYKTVEKYVIRVLKEFHAPFSLNESKTKYGSTAGANWMLGFMLNQEGNITVGHRRLKRLKATLTNYILDRKNGTPWCLQEVQTMMGEISYCKSIEKDQVDVLISRLSRKYGDIESAIRADLKSASQ